LLFAPTMLRPAVLSEYRPSSSAAPRMRLFTAITWVATLGCGAVGVFGTTYKAGPNGEHSLSHVQRLGRKAYEGAAAVWRK
jgi:hypothetical protein